jgi:predicted enzyme related to lactoylglutathione lyase
MVQAKPGHFVWYDHLARDSKAAIAFYTEVIGWTSQPFESGYTLFVGGQGPLAGTIGMEAARMTGSPPHWKANVFVADVEATVAQVRELGGSVLVEPRTFQIGSLAVVADPQGASINLFKPSQPQTLRDTTKPGEFVWHELVTTDHEAAFAFYSQLFGWQKSRDFDMGAMGKYLIYAQAGTDLGGMFTKPKDRPGAPHWLYYIQVANLDAAIERAKTRGATLLNGPNVVPGGARVAQLTDPQGAAFALHERAKSP